MRQLILELRKERRILMIHICAQEGFLSKWENSALYKDDQHDDHRNGKSRNQGICRVEQPFVFPFLPAQTLLRTLLLTGSAMRFLFRTAERFRWFRFQFSDRFRLWFSVRFGHLLFRFRCFSCLPHRLRRCGLFRYFCPRFFRLSSRLFPLRFYLHYCGFHFRQQIRHTSILFLKRASFFFNHKQIL